MNGTGEAEIIFTFRSTHDAIAAERALAGAGLGARVLPLPAQIGAGCGLCLRVWPKEWRRAAEALAAAGICPEGQWQRQGAGGQARYVPFEPI